MKTHAAKPFLLDFANQVLKTQKELDPYTVKETLVSLESAYKRTKREPAISKSVLRNVASNKHKKEYENTNTNPHDSKSLPRRRLEPLVIKSRVPGPDSRHYPIVIIDQTTGEDLVPKLMNRAIFSNTIKLPTMLWK